MDAVGSDKLKMILDCANLFHAGRAHPEFVRETLDAAFEAYGYDIVIVARHAAEHAPFEALMEEMTSLLRQLGAAENKPEVLADA